MEEQAKDLGVVAEQISRLNEYIENLDIKADTRKVKAAFKIAELLIQSKPECKKEKIKYKDWVEVTIGMSHGHSQKYIRAYEKFGGKDEEVYVFGLTRLIEMSPARLKDVPVERFLLEEIKTMTVKEVKVWIKENFPVDPKPKFKQKEVEKLEKSIAKKIEKLNAELEDGEITNDDIDFISDNLQKTFLLTVEEDPDFEILEVD